MNTLTIESPENKTIFVVLTRKENNALLNEQRYNLCEEVLNEHSFDFVSVDMEGEGKFNPKSLVKVIGKCPIESHGIDVPEFAMGYLQQEIDNLAEQVAALEREHAKMDPSTLKAQNMASWIDVMKDEMREKRERIDTDIRPKYIAKRIIELASRFDMDEVYVLHFGCEQTLGTVKAVLDEVDGVKAAILDSKKPAIKTIVFA